MTVQIPSLVITLVFFQLALFMALSSELVPLS